MELVPKDPPAPGVPGVVDAHSDVLLDVVGINKSFPGARISMSLAPAVDPVAAGNVA